MIDQEEVIKFTLAINQNISMELEYSEVVDFIGFFNNKPSSVDFYNELSTHPASQVRSEIAGKTCLPLETFERLANDASIEVALKVAGNKTAMQTFSAEQIVNMIRRDVSVALEIARYQLPFIKLTEFEAVISELTVHDDPIV